MKLRFRIIVLCFLSVSVNLFAQEKSAHKDITVEYIYKKDELGIKPVHSHMPRGLQWSPQGHLLAYLVSFATEAPNLVFYDPLKDATQFAITPPKLYHASIALASNPQGVTIEPTLTILPFAESATEITKIDRVDWLEEKNRIRLFTGNESYLFDPNENLLTKYDEPKRPKLPDGEKRDVTYSQNERYAAYTRASDLYVFDTESGNEIRLTQDGSDTVLNGRLPWVYWEELHGRTSYRAFEWSPKNDKLLFLQFDEGGVSEYPVTDYSESVPVTRMMLYPKAGTKNPSVRVGVVSLSTRAVRWVDLGEPHEYIVRMTWAPDGNSALIQTLNRQQNTLSLYTSDPVTGTSELVLQETGEAWVNVHLNPLFIEDSDDFLWLSERSGFCHLYRYSLDGKLKKTLSKGDWEVSYSYWSDDHGFTFDNDRNRVYFQASEASPLERQYYWTALNGGGIHRITHEPGNHSLQFSADRKYAVDTYRNVDTPRVTQVIDTGGKRIAVLGTASYDDYAPYRMKSEELIELKNDEGVTFYAKMLKPFDFDPDKKYPVIVQVYGGPGAQVVRNEPAGAMDMAFINKGFILFSIDNRGSSGRGHEWEKTVYREFGKIELKDLLFGVEYLKSLPYVDAERLGIWGWSYGGYFTCYAMTKAPGVFRAGAAVAPVTDFRLYDTIYTERYMGKPQDNEEGYRESAPVNFASQLEGKLLLAHGVSDDNVHIQNIYKMVDALIEAEKDYELYVFPQRDHGIGGDERRFFLFSKILDLFERELK